MDSRELKDRTKNFSVDVIRFLNDVPGKLATSVIAKQLIRSTTSIGANYREACRARSKKEFISKLGIVIGEADESMYWLEILRDSDLADKNGSDKLVKECNELVAIFTASRRTAEEGK